MEQMMTALQRLAEKIEAWRVKYETLNNENVALKTEVANASGNQSEKDEEIELLKLELEEKDVEIEKIISQVESLLA